MSYARTSCGCCGGCPTNCTVCETTTGTSVGGSCSTTKNVLAYDVTPYDCGAKPFNIAFTLGNNGEGDMCSNFTAFTGWDENPSHTSINFYCDNYSASNWYWSIDFDEDWIFNGLTFDYEASGWKKFYIDGGGDECDAYLFKLGQTTPTCCDQGSGRGAITCSGCGFSSFTVSAWAVSTDSDGGTNPALTPIEITDTDNYTAFIVEYDGDSDYVKVKTTASTITFTWFGGTYDGETCTIPVSNKASVPVACINAMNKGITANSPTDDFVGCCHSLNINDTNITSGGSVGVDYRKIEHRFYYRFNFQYYCYAELGNGAQQPNCYNTVWSGSNNCDTACLINAIEDSRGMQWDTDDMPLEMCQCISDMPFEKYYCANEYDFTRIDYTTGIDDCIVSATINPCGGTCNCFTNEEIFRWT